MECNPNDAYLVMRERRSDALRDAEQWRLFKSVKRCPERRPELVEGKQNEAPGWLPLSLKRLMPFHPGGGTGEPRSRRTVSSPTP